jgi:SAM-dependent methyltransferase
MAETGIAEKLTTAGSEYHWNEQNCPVCKVKPSKFVGKRGGIAHRERLGVETEIWKCAKCGLVFPNPMPFPKAGLGKHYDVGADDYFSAHDKDQKLRNADKLIEEAESILGGKGRLLDVGVGRGEILIAAKNRGWHVDGVEPSATFADYAEQRTGAKIWRQPIEESDIPANSYDVVMLAAVLEHLYAPDEVVKKISHILSLGGLLYVDVPNEEGLYFKLGNAYQKLKRRDWCINLAPTFPPYHVFGFGPASLKLLLAKNGLKPKGWRVYAGTSLVSSNGGLAGTIESIGAKMITAISNLGEMGTYIETWARKE